jgi:uncharacterized membrane protein YraQ (UPF0718 family)
VPLAAVLWQHGLSFGGVVAFLFGDLIILPIVNIHRKYYGWRAALVLLVLFYAAMVGAALAVEWLFLALHLTPPAHPSRMAMDMGFRWDHTAVLNIVFLALALVLLWRFFRSGGAGMLRHMNEPMDEGPEMHQGREHQGHGQHGPGQHGPGAGAMY